MTDNAQPNDGINLTEQSLTHEARAALYPFLDRVPAPRPIPTTAARLADARACGHTPEQHRHLDGIEADQRSHERAVRETTTTTVYISIGNSDDKLTQNEWARFHALVERHIHDHAQLVHGRWLSVPSDPWQNACWCIQIAPIRAEQLKVDLGREAVEFRQDSIAWAAVPATEFLRATP